MGSISSGCTSNIPSILKSGGEKNMKKKNTIMESLIQSMAHYGELRNLDIQ